ncbi:MAG TPA: zinc ribbon domain-containing protein [Candidatus Sulfotelmatobacter sp.]|jgi:hypothetical protein
MAFCNKCGSPIVGGTRFCNKCGAPILSSTLPSATPPPPASGSGPIPPVSVPAQGGGDAIKVILIIVGVIVLLGVLGLASAGFFAWRIAHHTRVREDGDNVKVETPFGSVETTKDAAEATRNLGVDLYPGAEVLKNGAATSTFGGIHTTAVSSETADSVDKVSDFYKSRFPKAMVTTSDSGHCTIIANGHGGVITINIEGRGDKTKIQITNVSHSSDGNSPSN